MCPSPTTPSKEPNVWQHSLRLAFVSWGDQRLRAAQRVLTLCPELALAHWFAATVFITRQAFDAAIKHLRDGCAAQDAQRKMCRHDLVCAWRAAPSLATLRQGAA
jgi:hypothetical protein